MRRITTTCLSLLALLAGFSVVWAKPDVLGNNPGVTEPDLLIHRPGEDLSAYRLDCDVFGWNHDFSEVAAVGVEIHRGHRGEQRGEAYLLVYNLQDRLPIHNMIAHKITHAALPNDPIPIEDARDLMWTMEGKTLDLWPKRPIYKHPKGGMEVTPFWYKGPPEQGLCTPLVGIVLAHQHQKRLVPFAPIDMRVNCDLLHYTDTRVYWGQELIAAAMIRFDFAKQPQNERSARFVVALSWETAKPLRIQLVSQTCTHENLRNAWFDKLSVFGEVDLQETPCQPTKDPHAKEQVVIKSQEHMATLSAYLAQTSPMGLPVVTTLQATDTAVDVSVVLDAKSLK